MADDFYYIDENLKRIRDNISDAAAHYRGQDDKVRLMAVTKTVAPEAVNHAVKLGVDLLGENRVQEYQEKKDLYDSSAEVQFIGSLQTNKVKYIIDSVSMIQSVDSIKLAQTINRYAEEKRKVMNVLCEVNIGGEDTKSGVMPQELPELLEQMAEMPGIRVRGLMTIPPPVQSDLFLGRMQELFRKQKEHLYPNVSMEILSMGMTHDYVDAIKYGSTLVRIGTGLFGARDYSKKN